MGYLALGLPAGAKFYVTDTPIEVLEWLDPYPDANYPEVLHFRKAVLRVEGRTVEVTDDKTIELLPQVFIGVGKISIDRIEKFLLTANGREELPASLLVPRLLIQAPRDIVILKEKLYLSGDNRKRVGRR